MCLLGGCRGERGVGGGEETVPGYGGGKEGKGSRGIRDSGDGQYESSGRQ